MDDHQRALRLAAVCLVTLPACGWLWPADAPYDPFRCEPACAVGSRCFEGQCVAEAADAGGAVGPGASDALAFVDVSAVDGTVLIMPDDDATPPGVPADGGAPVIDGPPPALGRWVTLAKGSFSMGSAPAEPCRGADEQPHAVTLTRGFEIQTTEVTQAQFFNVLGYAPSAFASCGDDCPVEQVSWHEAVAYCNALSAMAGLASCYACSGSGPSVSCDVATTYAQQQIYACPGYRLPTEAEWEYAYRAGHAKAYGPVDNDPASCATCDDTDPGVVALGWYCANASQTPHPVARKQPNAWGLYDAAGNVWEWCHDRHQASLGATATTDPWGAATGSIHTARGGSWANYASNLRAAYRGSVPATYRDGTIGFRCVRTR